MTGFTVRLLHRLDDPAGQRAHVRAPVPADLDLVAHAAEGEPHELAADGPRDGLAEGGLADAGGPTKQDRPTVVLQLADREVLEDALLDLVEAVVVRIEDEARVLDVEVVVALLRPGKIGDPVEVGARDGVLGARRRDRLQPVQLLLRDLVDLRGQARLLEPLLQLVELLLLLAELAELLLDRLELLAQVVLALRLRHLALHGGVDLVRELQDLALAVEELEDELHPRLQVGRLEDLLLLLDGTSTFAAMRSARWPGWVIDSTSSVAAAGSA